MPFTFSKLNLSDLVVVESEIFNDDRGFLLETYDNSQFRDAGIHVNFQLDILSRSKTGVIRGLHFQRPPYQQAKLIYCSEGQILDVAVDIREESDTFGDHVSLILAEDSNRMLFIPPGFAHGFAVMGGPAKVHYKLSNRYAPDYQAGIRWDDPFLNIDWQIQEPTVSDQDSSFPDFQDIKPLSRDYIKR